MENHEEIGKFWDLRYKTLDWPLAPDPLVTESFKSKIPGRVADLGAGTGRHSIWLAKNGWQVIAVDISKEGLRQLIERATAEGLNIETSNKALADWNPESNSLDAILMANLHMQSQELSHLIEKSVRALKNGGILVIIGHHLDNLGKHGPQNPDLLFTEEKLSNLVPVNLKTLVLDTRTRSHGSDVESEDIAVIFVGEKLDSHF